MARRFFRLVEMTGNQDRVFALEPGASILGSSRKADLCLTEPGVSRRHARLRIEGGLVDVEDLGSKNGTIVNGSRQERATLAPGDVLRLGGLELRLEETAPEDSMLGLVLDEEPGPPTQPASTEHTTIEMPGDIAGAVPALAGMEALVDALRLGAASGLGDVIQTWSHQLGWSAACLVEGSGPKAIVRAVHGASGALADDDLWLRIDARPPANQELGLGEGGTLAPSVAFASCRRPDGTPLSLVARTDRAGEEATLALLRVLVRLLDLRSPGASESAAPRPAAARELVFPEGFIPGRSARMREVYERLRPLAHSQLPVLLEGETGVGKEGVARILHLSSERSEGPYVAINCAAIPADLVEAELFGVATGAATGVKERRGRFQAADGGTLFLDEIGELPTALQAKLLRVLQEREVAPLGGAPAPIDVRFVSATNADLSRRVDEGRFRADLYYRVAGSVVAVPPLRTRREDISDLVDGLLRRFQRESEKSIRGVTVRALALLVGYSWPGNVRELEHELRRVVEACPGGRAIESEMLDGRIRESRPATGDDLPAASPLALRERVREVERQAVLEALAASGGSQRKAAKLLDISRNALARKIRDLEIPLSGPTDPSGE